MIDIPTVLLMRISPKIIKFRIRQDMVKDDWPPSSIADQNLT